MTITTRKVYLEEYKKDWKETFNGMNIGKDDILLNFKVDEFIKQYGELGFYIKKEVVYEEGELEKLNEEFFANF